MYLGVKKFEEVFVCEVDELAKKKKMLIIKFQVL
jgi:hypothetical protein